MPSLETNHPICDRQTGASPERVSVRDDRTTAIQTKDDSTHDEDQHPDVPQP
jgi:hypothetical protein